MTTTKRIPIETGIPLPPRAAKASKYPWDDALVDDSFFAKGVSVSSMTSAAQSYMKRDGTGKKFTAREEGDGTRVWRTK